MRRIWSSLHYRLCLKEEVFTSSFSIAGQEIIRNFIEHSVVRTMKKRKTLPVSADLEQALPRAAPQRERLSKMFRSPSN